VKKRKKTRQIHVGPVKIGDRLEGYLEDRKLLDFQVK